MIPSLAAKSPNGGESPLPGRSFCFGVGLFLDTAKRSGRDVTVSNSNAVKEVVTARIGVRSPESRVDVHLLRSARAQIEEVSRHFIVDGKCTEIPRLRVEMQDFIELLI